MKSIKNQYIDLKEGKMSEAQFMRNVRMTLPEYISNITLFKQAERILINKGIIQEGIHDRDILSSPYTNIKSLEQSPEQLGKAADDRSENILRARYNKQIQDPNISDDELIYILSGKGVKGFGGTLNAIEKIITDRNLNKIKESNAKSPLTINGKVVKTYTQNSDESYNVKYDEGGSETIMKRDKGWDDINTLRKNATNLSELKNTWKRYNLPNPDRQYNIYNSGRAVALRVNFLPNGKNYKEGDNIKRLQPGDKYEVVLNDQDRELLSIYPNHNQIIISQLKLGYTREDVISFLNGKGIKPNEDQEFNDPQSPEDRQPEQGDSHYDMFNENNSLKEVKDTSATGYYNQDGKEQYSKFNELDNMNAQEIMAGYVMEKQDNPNIDQKEAVKLVIKNLKSDQFYYTNYKLTGIRGLQPTEFTSTKRKPFFDEMEEVNKNGDNFVDEKNKMQIVKEGLDSEQNKEYKSELSVENIRNIIKDTNDYYRKDKTNIDKSEEDKSIRVFMNGDKIVGKTRTILDKLFNVKEESEDIDTDRLPLYTYFIYSKTDKMNEVMKPDSKLKLKELVRKMMKEIFDGRDNLTDINEMEEKPTKLTTKQLNRNTVDYLRKNADVIAKSIVPPGVPYVIKPTKYNDGINIMVKDLRSISSSEADAKNPLTINGKAVKTPDYENFMLINITVTQSTGFKYGNDLFSSNSNTNDITGENV